MDQSAIPELADQDRLALQAIGEFVEGVNAIANSIVEAFEVIRAAVVEFIQGVVDIFQHWQLGWRIPAASWLVQHWPRRLLPEFRAGWMLAPP